MNAMDLMKALGDIPEELVKTCFDEEFADNKTKAPSDTNSSDLPGLADPYQPEETDDDNNSVPPSKIGTKHIHFSGYIATVAACLAIVIGLPLIISYFNPKSSISPDDPFVPTRSQRESENPIVTEAKETNTSTTYTNKSTTSLSTAVYSTETTSEHQTTTETTAITTEENITESNNETTLPISKTESTTTSKTTTTLQATNTGVQTTSTTTQTKEESKFSFEHEGDGDTFTEEANIGAEIGFIITGLKDGESVIYSLSDEEVAQIAYSDNKQVTIFCSKEGKTILTAKSSDGQSFEVIIIIYPDPILQY